jgi:hypothetical protein
MCVCVCVAGAVTVANSSASSFIVTKGVLAGSDMRLGFAARMVDFIGNKGVCNATTDGSSVTALTVPPNLTTVSIASSNANPTLATIADVITLSFVSSRPLSKVSVAIFGGGGGGGAVSVSGSGTSFTATKTVSAVFLAKQQQQQQQQHRVDAARVMEAPAAAVQQQRAEYRGEGEGDEGSCTVGRDRCVQCSVGGVCGACEPGWSSSKQSPGRCNQGAECSAAAGRR